MHSVLGAFVAWSRCGGISVIETRKRTSAITTNNSSLVNPFLARRDFIAVGHGKVAKVPKSKT
jgi:hypothetical protein